MRLRKLVSSVVGLLSGFAACARPDPPGLHQPADPALRPTRGHLLISLDTLRADHLGAYGYHRDTSPFFDRLAKRGVLFERATVQFPSTLTSHMSLLTGLYPAEHGVYPPEGVLSDDIPTLAERFRAAGFRTAAFTEGGYVRGHFGFRRGFETFRARDRQGERDETERTFGQGLAFLRALAPGERFFLFLHTYAVHAPYAPPPQLRELFWPGPPPAGAIPPTGPALAEVNRRGERLPEPVVRFLEALYDAEIRHLDGLLAGFFGELERLDLLADTTVVITADHGEEFQEHGAFNHTQLYDETLHVPLLILHPEAVAGRRVAGLVESVDVAPTLAQIAGFAAGWTTSGASLVGELAGRATLAREDRQAYAEADGGRRALYQRQGAELFHALTFDPPGRAELYELEADPREERDLAKARDTETRRLVRALAAIEHQPVARAGRAALDPELEENLESLGYLH